MMSKRLMRGAVLPLAVVGALLWVAPPARAEAGGCGEFRESLSAMEASSVRPPGWYKLNLYLRAQYAENCAHRQESDKKQE